jgi:hypothetical protein
MTGGSVWQHPREETVRRDATISALVEAGPD